MIKLAAAAIKYRSIAAAAALVFYLLFLSVFASGSYPAVLLPAVLGILAVTLLLLLMTACADGKPFKQVLFTIFKEKPGSVSFLAATILMLLIFQTLYLPPGFDRLSGEIRMNQNSAARGLLEQIESITDINMSVNFAMSRNRSGSLRFLLHFAALIAVFLLTKMLPAAQRSNVLLVLIFFGVLMALLGVLHQWVFPRPKTIWWLYNIDHGRPLGAFPNRTHHAGLLALIAPAAMSFTVYAVRKRSVFYAALYATCLVIMTGGIILSLSRGAFIAMLAGLITGLLPLVDLRNIKNTAALTVALLLTGILAFSVFTFTPDEYKLPAEERLATLQEPLATPSAGLRFKAWRDSLRIWRIFPLTGCGANGYRMLQPSFRTNMGRKAFHHVENEYLQLLAEGGVLGFFLIMSCIAAVLLLLRRKIYSTDRGNRFITAAASGALGAALIHNAIDIPAHNPLYAAVAVILVTTVVAESEIKTNAALRWTALLIFTSLYLLLNTAYGSSPQKMRLDSNPVIAKASIKELGAAVRDAPTYWFAWYHMGDRLMKIPSPKAIQTAEECLQLSVQYNPGHARVWQMLGWIRFQQGKDESAREAFDRMLQLRPWMRTPQPQPDIQF